MSSDKSNGDWRDTRHWLAWAPPGIWSSGPSVVVSEKSVAEYRTMGWDVRGPFTLADAKSEKRLYDCRYNNATYAQPCDRCEQPRRCEATAMRKDSS